MLWGKIMKNGYFQIVNDFTGFGVRLYPPSDNGEEIRLGEIADYLNAHKLQYNSSELKNGFMQHAEVTIHLGEGPCPVIHETFQLMISEDNMSVTVRFYPPSDTGKRMRMDEFVKDLQHAKVVYGVSAQAIQHHFQTGIYCTDLLVAKGKAPRHGTDAKIEYYFNTDVHARPTMLEDGSVDFFHLNTINHCKKGDILARLIPEDPGENGINIQGIKIKPRDVKRIHLQFGNNIELSEDKLSITSKVDGHVTLVEGKVFVADVLQVENVDNSTGNIEFEGSVQVNGNVQSNFRVFAKGNVVVNGVVEGAFVEAGGDIIIARGMNGMGKGNLKAGGNIVVKFLENTTVIADGYINAGSILHSKVMSGTDIEVDGRKGFITGGRVCAANKVCAKTLGSDMGTSTIVEVGVNPELKQEYLNLQKEVTEIVRVIKNSQPVMTNFAEKRAKGARFSEEQLKYVRSVALLMEDKKQELETKNNRMKELQTIVESQSKATVMVKDVAYSGTTIVIGDVSMAIQNNCKFCRFEKIRGDVKMCPM